MTLPPLFNPSACRSVELRQYTLYPGQRDTLIALFERELIAPQQAAGMHVFGPFRDLDDPDRFVWLRGFADLAARPRALAAFYDGPVWQAHRDAANATMIDSDNVLLLRPVSELPMPIDTWQRDAHTSPARYDGGLLAAVFPLDAGRADPAAPASPSMPVPTGARIDALLAALSAPLGAAGGQLAAAYVTEPSPNRYPRLPVREGESVLVWLARFDSLAACCSFAATQASPFALERATRAAALPLIAPPQLLRLAPTAGACF